MEAEATATNYSKRGGNILSAELLSGEQIQSAVEEVLAETLFIDIHTHLFSPAFGKLGLWGIDELLTYHYLDAEFFRSSNTTPDEYWKLSKRERADATWQALFVETSPISEATRGIIAVLRAFDLPTDASALEEARKFFRTQSIEEHIRRVFQIAGVSNVVMTNDPLDLEERAVWLNGAQGHTNFHAALRLDRILWGWPAHWKQLASQGYAVGRGDLHAVENLCRSFAENKVVGSTLSRENQHELCVYARKFNNLMPFGCWWFLNNPSIVEEITRERIEMLGTSFI